MMGVMTTPTQQQEQTAPSRGDASGRTWTIREIADEFGITHRTVRHYEELIRTYRQLLAEGAAPRDLRW